MSKRQTWTMPDDERFAATEYVVEATDGEQHALWWRYSELYAVPWKEQSRGYTSAIGQVAKRPIVVSVQWASVGGSLVAFVAMSSQLTDYDMCERWQAAVFPCLENSGRHTDASNFGSVLDDIGQRCGTQLVDSERRARVESHWMADDTRQYADDDPQRALERADRKVQEWAEAAMYWQKRACAPRQ